jgi:glucose-6-phosphate-specific signal transduction histidine kinase
MKTILICLVIATTAAVTLTSEKESLGDRIGQNITKLRSYDTRDAHASSNVNQHSAIIDTSALTVHQHIRHLRRLTPRRCEQSHRILDSAALTYGHNEKSRQINLSITQINQQTCL